MAKIAVSLNLLLPLTVLLNNLVFSESDAGVGLEIPPQNPNPRRQHQQAHRNWEAWTSPEGQLWYPGRVDYRNRQRQTGDGAGATSAESDGHDTSTRRYFSLEEGPQFLSEHRLANSAHSQYGQGEVEERVGGGRDSERDWYPPRGQYGTAEESQFPGEGNGQYPVYERDQYGSYGNGRYAGNVPYGQYFLNGERVPDSVDPLAPKPNVDYIPDHMRETYKPGQAVQGAQYVPVGNSQFIPKPDRRYIPENIDPSRIDPNGHYIHPDYAAVPDPNGEQNGRFQAGNEPESYYINGRDDLYPDSQYPYYYGEGEDYEQVGVDGGEYDEYIPHGQPYDQSTFYERGQQPWDGKDSHIPAGEYEKQPPEEDTGHPIHRPNPDSNHMIFAGRDFLPAPTVHDNHPAGQRGVPDSLTKYDTEARQEIPNLVQTDGRRRTQNQSISESGGIRGGHYSQVERDRGLDRRISHSTRTVRPAERHPETTHKTTTTSTAPTTTVAKTTTTTTHFPTTRPTPSTTTPTPTTTRTTTTLSAVPPLPYDPRHGKPSRYPTREQQRGRGTNSHRGTISGERRGFDEAMSPQRPTIPPVQIDLSKLMPEEEIHGPEDSRNIVNSFRHPVHPHAGQRSTMSPSGSVEYDRRRHPQGERGDAHGTDTPSQRGYYAGGRQPYQRPDQQSRYPHSSQTGSTGSSVGRENVDPPRNDIIRPRQPSIGHRVDDETSRQHSRDSERSLSYWPETPRYGHRTSTDQRSRDTHRANPERSGYGSYQPTDGDESHNYAAGRDRTHSQGRPEVDTRYGSTDDTETKRQIFDASLDKGDSSSDKGLPGVSHRGACPSVSQCRCCRWSTQQSRKTMECLQPKYKTVEVQVCTEEKNGVCVRTGKRKTLKPNGTEVKMCSKVQLKRSCFVCCPTFYPRGHNQTCNGVLDGIDKTGLRVSFEADIRGFYQPPRVSKSATPSENVRHEVVQDQPHQQERMSSEMNGQSAYRAIASSMADSEKRVVPDEDSNGYKICIVYKIGPNGQRRAERRPCPSKVEPPQSTAKEENTTGACCLTREQLGNLFLRYCCNTKRYNGRVYSQRQCCGTKETSPRRGIEREPLVDRDAGFDVRRREEERRTESESSRLRVDSLLSMDSESRIPRAKKVSQIEEDSDKATLETRWPSESESQRTRGQFQNANARPVLQYERDDAVPNPEYARPRTGWPVDSDTETRGAESAEEWLNADGNTQRKCCSPGTRLRSREELPDSNREKSGRRTSGLWMRVYSCCANGNYLQKIACCLRKSPVSPLCCTKVSRMRS